MIKLIILTEGGMILPDRAKEILVDKLFTGRIKENVIAVDGPEWNDPAVMVRTLRRGVAVATIFRCGVEYCTDKVISSRKRRKLRRMFADAKPGETSWDVAMRLHDEETRGYL